jgi:hypothetical protein
MSDRALYLKPGECLYVLYKGSARIRTHETVQKLLILCGHLVLGKPHRFSSKEVHDLKKLGHGSLLDGYRAKHTLDERPATAPDTTGRCRTLP